MRFNRVLLVCAGSLLVVAGCEPDLSEEKIGFDLEILNDEGLFGPPDGLRSLDYEFCVPGGKNAIEEVKSIDPSVVCREGRGRIGCTAQQQLCIGNTQQPDHKRILKRLAGLRYVDRIEQTLFE